MFTPQQSAVGQPVVNRMCERRLRRVELVLLPIVGVCTMSDTSLEPPLPTAAASHDLTVGISADIAAQFRPTGPHFCGHQPPPIAVTMTVSGPEVPLDGRRRPSQPTKAVRPKSFGPDRAALAERAKYGE